MNHYYLYAINPGWGPTFLKVCGYAPRSRNAALTATRAHQAPGLTRNKAHLVHAERTVRDCGLGEPQLISLMAPGQTPAGKSAPGLNFGQFRIMALAAALRFFGLTPDGITNPQLRPRAALVLGLPEGERTLG